LGKWGDRLLTLNKKTNQNRNDIEGGKKTQYNCNRHGPIFPPNRFELMPNSSPERFFASHRDCFYGFFSLFSLFGFFGLSINSPRVE